MTAPWAAPAEITDVMRQHARENPRAWVYVIDPEFNQDGHVPGWGIRGAYPTTAAGEIDTAGWLPNEHYQPGPRTRGFPVPTNTVERVLELAATGYGPNAALARALAEAELIFPTNPAEPDTLQITVDGDGNPSVTAFTSRPRLTEQVRSYQSLPVRAIGDALRGAALRLNPGSPPSVTLPGDDIAAALGAR